MGGPVTAYLVICHWARFQHYKDRNPPWIKNYTELLSDEAYLELSGHRRAILHGLWLEYARSHCRLPVDTRILTRRLNLKVTMADLAALSHAGFTATSDSAPQAPRPSPDSTPRARSQEAEAERAHQVLSSANGPEGEPADEAWGLTGSPTSNGASKSLQRARTLVQRVGAEYPSWPVLRDELLASSSVTGHPHYPGLTDDDLIELADLHADLQHDT